MRLSKSKRATEAIVQISSNSTELAFPVPPRVNSPNSVAISQPSTSGSGNDDDRRGTPSREGAATPSQERPLSLRPIKGSGIQPHFARPSFTSRVSESGRRPTSRAVSKAPHSDIATATNSTTNSHNTNSRTLQTHRLFSARQLSSSGSGARRPRQQQRRASLSDVAERRCGGNSSRLSDGVKNNIFGSIPERTGSLSTQGVHHSELSHEADKPNHHSITDWKHSTKDSLTSLTSTVDDREQDTENQQPFPRLLSTIRAARVAADDEHGQPAESERRGEPLRMKALRFSRQFRTQKSLDKHRRSKKPELSDRNTDVAVTDFLGEDGKTNPHNGDDEPAAEHPTSGQLGLALMMSGSGSTSGQVAPSLTLLSTSTSVPLATVTSVTALSNNNRLKLSAATMESNASLENGATPVDAVTLVDDTTVTVGKKLSRVNGSATTAVPQPAPVITSLGRSPLTNLFVRFRRQRRHNSVLPLSTTRLGSSAVGGGASTSAGADSSIAPLDAATSTTDDCETTRRVKMMWCRVIFDANENHFYYWIAVVSTVYVYNLLVVIARTVFVELAAGYLWILWLAFDVVADLIYLGDMFVRSRTGYLEQGLLIRDGRKIMALYLRSVQFKLDVTSVLPLDYAFQVMMRKNAPYLRFNRLLKRERLQKFMEQTETRSALPNAFRVGVVVWYIAIIIHWNACLYFMISESIGLGSDGWVYGKQNGQSLPENVTDTLTRRYIYSFYWSTLILTTIGEVPGPQQNIEYTFVTIDLMCGVLIFATIVGNVGSMISNMSAARTDFQNRIDGIKQYMELRKVGKQLEIRVIKWFDYLWANKQNLADQQVLKVLPDKLQAEIAMHVHFETLRKVRIFQDCEAGLLAELVLKLQLQVFSPMDYVCRKGDIGREMYIVKRGMLQVVNDDGSRVFATLSEGAVFGELSILNIAGSKNGNRRTANVRSLGYTDLFVLNKSDLWVALKEYPEARKILIQRGRELLRKDNLLDENAPEENKTAEEIAEELQQSVRIVQTRIARLTAEHLNTESKLRDRIAYLERKLGRYGTVLRRQQRCTDAITTTSTDDEVGDGEEAREAANNLPSLSMAEPHGVSNERE